METIKKPWEYISHETIKKTVKRKGYPVRRSTKRINFETYIHSYPAKFETLKNYDHTFWKLGDVVRFGDGVYPTVKKRWEYWFQS